MGTHHLEYGFPSTHSANGAGMTVFFYHCLLLWRTAIENKGEADRIPIVDYLVKDTYLLETVLILYAITIVYGRIYMGMHSLSGTWRPNLKVCSQTPDCIAGVVIGVSVALFSIKYDTFLGAYLEQPTILGMSKGHMVHLTDASPALCCRTRCVLTLYPPYSYPSLSLL